MSEDLLRVLGKLEGRMESMDRLHSKMDSLAGQLSLLPCNINTSHIERLRSQAMEYDASFNEIHNESAARRARYILMAKLGGAVAVLGGLAVGLLQALSCI